MVSIVLLLVLVSFTPGISQDFKPPPTSITTPDSVETRIGMLEFQDGLPSKETLKKIYDNLDFSHAVRAFSDTLQGVSILAVRKGLSSVGAKDNEVIVFSELMDAKSLFLWRTPTIPNRWSKESKNSPRSIPTIPAVSGHRLQHSWQANLSSVRSLRPHRQPCSMKAAAR
jgi:hypothetical protein